MATAGKERANILPLSPNILGQLTLHILPNRSTLRALLCSPTMHKSTTAGSASVQACQCQSSEQTWGLGTAGALVSQPPCPHFQASAVRVQASIPRDHLCVSHIRCTSQHVMQRGRMLSEGGFGSTSEYSGGGRKRNSWM